MLPVTTTWSCHRGTAGLVDAQGGFALEGQVVVDRECADGSSIARAEIARGRHHRRTGDACRRQRVCRW